MEFLELGLVVQVGKEKPRTIWKVYGSSNSGTYGENNGIGSLEAVVEGDTGETHGVVDNIQGDIIASVDSGKHLCWQKEVLSSYGPIEVPSSVALETATAKKPGTLAEAIIEASTWKGRRVDPTGFINLGARHYDPLTGRFLSCDPLGHAATPDLYAYADGDPVNNIDPDGRFFSAAYKRADAAVSSVWYNTRFQGGLEALGGLTETAAGVAASVFSGGAAIPAGVLATTHGADHFATGITQLVTGQPTQSLTTQALLNAGASDKQAVWADLGIGMATLNAGSLSARLGAIAGRAALVLKNQAAGNAARDAIALREAPALIEQTFKTVGGARRVDVLKQGEKTIAIESKVGEVGLSKRIRPQLARDWWLKRNGLVDDVIWEFSPSQTTGILGPDIKLQKMIKKLGFQLKINQR